MALLFIAFAVVLGLAATRVFGGRPSYVTLKEYQRAVLFRRGLPVRDVGPGRHRVWSGIDKMMIVDARPVQVSYENQAVLLKDGSLAAYALSGSARVNDARKAMYAAGNYNNVPSFVMLCCTRGVLNECSSMELSKEGASEKIIDRAKPRLDAAGFELLSFKLTQLTVAQRMTGITGSA